MTLEDAKKAYEGLSGKASDIMRQLALGGIALIWLFRTETAKGPTLQDGLIWAAIFICAAIICDFLQYVVGTFIWFLYFRRKEREGLGNEDEFMAPPYINKPTWGLFIAKGICVLVAYLGFLIPYLIRRFGVAV